jgi:opacity protein-like surface antigen
MRFKLTLACIASFMAIPVAAAADELSRGVYVGVFGGGGFGSSTDVTQRGTAYFIEAQGGPLAVDAKGSAGSGGVGFVGAQIGHEWSYNALMLPAFELEGFYLSSGTRRATQTNPTNRLPAHIFDNSYPTDNGVFLANMVLSFPTSYPGWTPYVGLGIGAAVVSIDGANSLQTAPPEPGVNHFNSGPDSSAWTFATQLKAGVRVAVSSNAYLFGEYRYLYVGSTEHTFGSTVFPGHVETSPWTVNFGGTSFQLATAGIGIGF